MNGGGGSTRGGLIPPKLAPSLHPLSPLLLMTATQRCPSLTASTVFFIVSLHLMMTVIKARIVVKMYVFWRLTGSPGGQSGRRPTSPSAGGSGRPPRGSKDLAEQVRRGSSYHGDASRTAVGSFSLSTRRALDQQPFGVGKKHWLVYLLTPWAHHHAIALSFVHRAQSCRTNGGQIRLHVVKSPTASCGTAQRVVRWCRALRRQPARGTASSGAKSRSRSCMAMIFWMTRPRRLAQTSSWCGLMRCNKQ